MMSRFVCLAGIGLLLTACASTPEPVPVVEKIIPPSGSELLAQVRGAAQENDGVLDVQPLRDGLVEDLRRQAESFEHTERFGAAAEVLSKALELSPGDPELSQLHAEMLLADGDLDNAERRAWQAYESGPKVGSLCRRNWATVRVARQVRGDAVGADKAAERIAHCTVQAPVRM